MALKLNKTVYGTSVLLKMSGEMGKIAGFAQYQRHKQNQFYVEYVAADGRQVSDWFFEDQIEVAA